YKTTDNPKKHTVWIRFGQNKLDDTASHYWKNNEKIPPFYTKATALFINILDCATYKERNKIKHPSPEDDKAINQTKNLISLDEELIDGESENDDESIIDNESTNSGTTTDNESLGATTTVDEFTSDTTIDYETTDDELIDGCQKHICW
ncbi:unnamed protein product, partial [Rotaria sordida]